MVCSGSSSLLVVAVVFDLAPASCSGQSLSFAAAATATEARHQA